MGGQPHDILSFSRDELAELIRGMGEPAYRAKQIFGWLHKKGAASYGEMTNIPGSLKERLAMEYSLPLLSEEAVQVSAEDGTRKYLFSMRDGNTVETVRMTYMHGHTVCVSSQCGCRMGCAFCASTVGGLIRGLTAGEIVSQVYEVERDTGERVSNVVLMGMGEPFDNYDSVIRAIRLLSDDEGKGISARNITLSTCGLPEGIRKLSREGLQINLALSLHAPNDELRARIMPVARSFKLREVLAAMGEYYDANRRRLTFEYSLIKNVNDSEQCAEELASLVRPFNALVNLIPVNPVREAGLAPPSPGRVAAFKKMLENRSIHVTIRREMGRDIDGACGQLRSRMS